MTRRWLVAPLRVLLLPLTLIGVGAWIVSEWLHEWAAK